MKCTNCKKDIEGKAKFCPHCGTEIIQDDRIEKKYVNSGYLRLWGYKLNKQFWINLVLVFFSFLLIPVIFTLGYLIKILHSSLGKKLPDFDSITMQLKNGFSALFIILTYFFIPFILSILVVSSIGLKEGIKNLYAINLFVFISSGVLGIIAIILVLIASFILPIALTNFAHTKKIGSAFHYKSIFKLIFEGFSNYFAIFFFGIVISLIITWIMKYIESILLPLSTIGLIIFLLLSSFIWTYVVLIWARMYNKFYISIKEKN